MVRGTLLQNITPLQGIGGTVTLAHPEGPYMQMRRRIRLELNPFGEVGEWIEDGALHNQIPHLYLARQKPIKRVHCESDHNKSEHTGTREEAKNKLEQPEGWKRGKKLEEAPSLVETRAKQSKASRAMYHRLKGLGTETQRQARKNYPTHGEGTEHF